jgi:hypothetical protein
MARSGEGASVVDRAFLLFFGRRSGTPSKSILPPSPAASLGPWQRPSTAGATAGGL